MRAFAAAIAILTLASASASAGELTGHYMESRTCQVYTGPCFANAEISLAGKDAIMAWKIDQGQHRGVDLAGLNVVVVVRSSDTLAYNGIADAREVKSVVYIDDRADARQQQALLEFAQQHTGKAGKAIARVSQAPIQMSLDPAELKGSLSAGKDVTLITRAARQGDCICSNEVAFYPPLTPVENFAAGVATEGEFKGRGLGTRWSIPDSRSVYMATFAYSSP